MPTDAYTKVLLTVIAVSLAVIAGQNFIPTANAQSGHCGETLSHACYVTAPPQSPIYVESNPSNGLYVATIPGQPLEIRANR